MSYLSMVLEKSAKFFRGSLFVAPGRPMLTRDLLAVANLSCNSRLQHPSYTCVCCILVVIPCFRADIHDFPEAAPLWVGVRASGGGGRDRAEDHPRQLLPKCRHLRPNLLYLASKGKISLGDVLKRGR